MSCEQTNERIIDFLYGELPEVERQAFERHLAGCERCRGEVAGLREARQMARAALDQDEPPPRVRRQLLDAAAAEVAARPRAPARAARRRWSVIEWVRGRWTLPTLATAGAVAVLVLASRVFLNPEKTIQRGREAVQGEGALPAEPAPVAPPGAAAPAPEAPKPLAEELRAAPPASHRDEAARAPRQLTPASKPASAAREASPGGRRPDPPSARRKKAEPISDFEPAPSAAPERAPAAKVVTKRQVSDNALDALTEGRGQGARPADRPMAAERKQEPAAPASADELEEASDEPRAASREHARPPAPRAPDDLALASKPRAPAPASSGAAAGKAAVEASRAPAAPAASGSPAAPVSPALVERADRLFRDGRWAEAAVAYRDLLRRWPSSPAAARWRAQLTAAEARARAAASPSE